MAITRRRLRRIVGLGGQVLLLLALGLALTLRLPQVTGTSMAPQIHDGEWVVLETITPHLVHPWRGEIVAFTHDAAVPQVFLKRIVALPGDTVRIDDGSVVVDGALVPEPYVAFHDRRGVATLVVPPDSYFVLGDNRVVSDDSRAFGPIAGSTLVGHAILGLWPPSQFGVLR